MENRTFDVNDTKNVYSTQKEYFLNFYSDIALFTVTLYLLISLTYHRVHVEQQTLDSFSNFSLEQKYAFTSKVISAAIAIILLIRESIILGLNLIERSFYFQNFQEHNPILETLCQVFTGAIAVTLITIIGLVSTFLWIRQRVLYTHPSLDSLNSTFVKVSSFSSILLWLTYSAVVIISYFVFVRYKLEKDVGCVTVNTENTRHLKNLVVSIIVSSGFLQSVLLGLFIYPILKRVSWKDKSNRNSALLWNRVKKAVAITSICLATDITCFLIAYTFRKLSYFNIYSFNLFINFLLTIIYFDHWKTLLWPWKAKPEKLKFTKDNFISASSDI